MQNADKANQAAETYPKYPLESGELVLGPDFLRLHGPGQCHWHCLVHTPSVEKGSEISEQLSAGRRSISNACGAGARVQVQIAVQPGGDGNVSVKEGRF